jgi:hypothetical protein
MPRSDLEPLYWGHAKALTCCLLQISLVAILTVAGNPRPQAPSCPRPRNRYRNMFSTYNSRRNPRSALQRRATKAAQSKIPSGNSMNTWNFCRKFLPQTVNPKKIHPDSRSTCKCNQVRPHHDTWHGKLSDPVFFLVLWNKGNESTNENFLLGTRKRRREVRSWRNVGGPIGTSGLQCWFRRWEGAESHTCMFALKKLLRED